jgi:DNA-binding GntR family transcriptional regulator
VSGTGIVSVVAAAPPRAAESLADQAYRVVSRWILTRRLAGGQVIVEGRLAEQFNISRTPIREALLRLEAEGLLVKQGSGSYAVRRITASEFFQSMRIRALLEPEAAALAAGRIALGDLQTLRSRIASLADAPVQEEAHWEVDDRLHDLVAAASGNPVLAHLICDLRRTTRLLEVVEPFDRVAADAEEHTRILDTIETGDRPAARRAMATHLRNVERAVLATISR